MLKLIKFLVYTAIALAAVFVIIGTYNALQPTPYELSQHPAPRT